MVLNNGANPHEVSLSLEKVEHPSIASTLVELGMLRDIQVETGGKATVTLVLPFPNVPDSIRDNLVQRLAGAAQTSCGELTRVNLAYMSPEEQQRFLIVEQKNWRG